MNRQLFILDDVGNIVPLTHIAINTDEANLYLEQHPDESVIAEEILASNFKYIARSSELGIPCPEHLRLSETPVEKTVGIADSRLELLERLLFRFEDTKALLRAMTLEVQRLVDASGLENEDGKGWEGYDPQMTELRRLLKQIPAVNLVANFPKVLPTE